MFESEMRIRIIRTRFGARWECDGWRTAGIFKLLID